MFILKSELFLTGAFITPKSKFEKVKEWKDSMKEKAKEAIEGFIENVVEGAKSIPQKIPEIGKAIVDGIWKGIKDAKRTFHVSTK